MKLAFIVTCLEPGSDGVGDYTRILARECALLGHQSMIFSVKDSFIKTNEPFCGNKNSNYDVKEVRYKNGLKSKSIERLSDEILEWNPDWVSIQFVSYGFNTRGFVFGLISKISNLVNGRKIHIMMHELWIGESIEYGLKDRLIGFVQKKGITNFVQKLSPAIIHTSNPAYHFLLSQCGVQAKVLPLFGNIPLVADADFGEVYSLFDQHGLKFDHTSRKEYLLVGNFGILHPGWDPQDFINQLVKYQGDTGKKIALVAIGRIGKQGQKLWDTIASRYAESLSIVTLGELPVSLVSKVLQILDFGITTTPWSLAGKSGTVAAMVDHGLPVVFLRDNWRLRSAPTPLPTENPLLHKFDSHFAEILTKGLNSESPQPSSSTVATQFLEDLCN